MRQRNIALLAVMLGLTGCWSLVAHRITDGLEGDDVFKHQRNFRPTKWIKI